MNELALFAGVGGGILAGKLLGWQTVCAVERDAYAAAVLAHRQDEECGQAGVLEPFPIWSDVRTFDGRPWRGIVDVVSGGFPCQDISVAGSKAGINGERSILWVEMARIIREVRRAYAWVENSPNLVNCGLDRVLADLAALGFDARWGVLGAGDLGAWHQRDRIWIKATHADRLRELQPQGSIADIGGWTGNGGPQDANPLCVGHPRPWRSVNAFGAEAHPERQANHAFHDDGWWTSEPNVVRVVHGVPHAVDRIRGLGNAQIPIVAASAWRGL
ncbi:MAG: DNA cytosine methyltransferase [Bradyrhizobium sp.]|nr:DNA cytosine methyltransferase [Bradyrhizobium sp.]